MLTDILSALAVVVSVGLFLGILLALFIHFLGIREDEKTKKIRDALPGINCGACGFKGCNDYAEALSKGNAKPNLCIPGAEATAKELGEILGVEVEQTKDFIAFVHCNGTCDVTSTTAIYDGVDTCRGRSMIYGGLKSCRYGCLGCGDCAKVCVSDAISIENGIARVNTDRCVGCGMCAKTCPKNIISMIPQHAATAVFCCNKDKGADAIKVCKRACIACRKCVKACPSEAISIVDNCAVIDYTKCTECGLCAEVCPTGCLQKVCFPDLPDNFSLN